MATTDEHAKVGLHDADPLIAEFERAMYDVDDMPEIIVRLTTLVLVLARREAYWRGLIHGKGLLDTAPREAIAVAAE